MAAFAYGALWRRIPEHTLGVHRRLVGEALRERLGGGPSGRRIESFSFVGSGCSEQGDLAPVSERLDKALGEAYVR